MDQPGPGSDALDFTPNVFHGKCNAARTIHDHQVQMRQSGATGAWQFPVIENAMTGMEQMAEFAESIVGAAGALVAALTLAMGTVIVTTPAHAQAPIVGADQPIKLARVQVEATALPDGGRHDRHGPDAPRACRTHGARA